MQSRFSSTDLPFYSKHLPPTGARLGDFSADRRLLLLALMALVVGTAGAAAAWALLHLINLVTNLAYFGRFSVMPASISGNDFSGWSVLIPVVGCLIIGMMARYGSEKIRGHGIPEAMEAILIGRSQIKARVAVLKPLSSAISIGTGGPFGAEGPIIMTGGAFGSLFAQFFRLTDAERKTLLVAGAAAGMTATFGTPVAAMLLAVELLLFEWKPRSFVPVAIASVVAAAWRPWLMGSGALFPMTISLDISLAGLVFASILGIICGLGSGLLTQMVYTSEDLFQRLPVHWMWWPVLGGLAIGIGGLIEPHALGVGYDNIAALLAGGISILAVLRLMIVKALIWSIALGSGTSGGVLAPLLIIGGALGSLFGNLAPVDDSGLWALLGMAAMMGGTMRSPLTAMIFAVELTHNINALLPLAVACSVAHATTVLLLRRSILTEKVARRGHHITREYVIDPFESVRIAQIMTSPADTLAGSMPVAEAIGYFSRSDCPARHTSYPVVNETGRLLGVVAHTDLQRWANENPLAGCTLEQVMRGHECIVGFDDELAGQIADRMTDSDTGVVPILNAQDKTVVGIVTWRDLMRIRTITLERERKREALIKFPYAF